MLGLKFVFLKRSASKIWGGGVSEVWFKKLDSFTLETSKNHLIRNFLRNGRLRVNLRRSVWWARYPWHELFKLLPIYILKLRRGQKRFTHYFLVPVQLLLSRSWYVSGTHEWHLYSLSNWSDRTSARKMVPMDRRQLFLS